MEKTDYGALFVSGDQNYRLYASMPLTVGEGEVFGEVMLQEGEHAYLVFEAESREVEKPRVDEEYVVRSFKETSNYWRNWLAKSNYTGRWREMVQRSALVLKLLQHKDHGSFIAAATFALPEVIGGERNWDYRYSWIRDAAFTLYALMRLGFTEEAVAFEEWLFSRASECSEDGSMQIMYGIDGRRDLTEQSLDHLRGYKDSRPVLIGNAAYDQLQLDIYGELMDAVYLANKYARRIHHDPWKRLTQTVEYVCRNWDRPDEGIWEVRGGRKKFLSSRLMCWVAIDRAFRMAHKNSLPAPLDKWSKVRNEIHESIYRDFWNEQVGAFVQHAGSMHLDASVLLMPLVRFISPTDPYWLSTMRVVKERLVKDCLVLRYDNEADSVDGLTGVEGTFTTCAFWYVESLARSGDALQARYYFEKMLSYANHLGLYSEELSPAGEHLGNFPQALTHLALISAAYALNRAFGEKA
jgi:GH15 family glucan-1,4-alpha-glucosidase